MPTLRWIDAIRDRLTPREKLLAEHREEITSYKRRLQALIDAHDDAITTALQFENSDWTAMIREIAASPKGALGVRLRQVREENRELTKQNTEMAASEANAWKTCDSVLDAWKVAAGLKAVANWDKNKAAWVVDVKSTVLPADICVALKAWVEDQKKPKT